MLNRLAVPSANEFRSTVTNPAGSPLWFTQCLAALIDRRDLTDEQMRGAISEVMAGIWSEAETAAVLVALRMKGETAIEIAAAAAVLRQHMVRLETVRDDILDTCGTGG